MLAEKFPSSNQAKSLDCGGSGTLMTEKVGTGQ